MESLLDRSVLHSSNHTPMRSTIALFSVSIVTLLFTNDPVNAQCASGWGCGIPDGRHSPCFEVKVDTNTTNIGALPSHDELISNATPAADDNRWKGSTNSILEEAHHYGMISLDGDLGSSVVYGGVISGEGFITNDSIAFSPKALKKPVVRNLFLRSSEQHRTVWPAAPFK